MTESNRTEKSQDTKTVENEILNSENLDSLHGGSEPSLDFLGQFAGQIPGMKKNIEVIPPQPALTEFEMALAALPERIKAMKAMLDFHVKNPGNP